MWWIELYNRLGLVPTHSPVFFVDIRNGMLVFILLSASMNVPWASMSSLFFMRQFLHEVQYEINRIFPWSLAAPRTKLSCSKIIDLLAFVNLHTDVLHPFDGHVSFSLPAQRKFPVAIEQNWRIEIRQRPRT